METKTNYTLVGLVVLILLTGLITVSIWLSTGFDRKAYNYYTVYMRESVSGLNDESMVKYNGVKVGSVAKVELSQFDPQQVKVTLKIEDGTPITTSTHATLITQGITGNTYLGLSASAASFTPLQKTPGEPYPVIPSKPSFFSQLEKDLDKISQGFERILTKENANNLKETLTSLRSISDTIAKNNDHINESLKTLPKVVKQLESGIKEFKKMTADMANAGKQVSVTMVAGKKTLDKLSQQTIPPVVLLLRRLDVVAANLEEISEQMRQNPAVLIRGNTPAKPGPGEEK